MSNDLLPIRVLIIDDDYDKCEIIKMAFKTVKDIDVCGTASDGTLGIKMVMELRPDVVLLDVVMPKLDGIEVAKRIQNLDIGKIPQIIMLTAIGNQNIINTAFEVGADYYLRKPVDLMNLVEKVRMVHEMIGNNNIHDVHKSEIKLIKEIVSNIGVPVNLTGYKYIVEVLKIMLKESLTFKQMYEIVANDNNTSNQCVEILIRNAIRKAADTKNEFYISVFDKTCNKNPSNSLFLETVKEIIYMKISD